MAGRDEQFQAQLKASLAQQAERERELAASGQRAVTALTAPVASHRALTSVVAIASEGDTPVLLVGLATGERWEVPMNQGGAKRLTDGLAEHWADVERRAQASAPGQGDASPGDLDDAPAASALTLPAGVSA